MQFLTTNSIVSCPVCGVALATVSEQDRRVATMKHEEVSTCEIRNRQFRVDRISGYGEEQHDA